MQSQRCGRGRAWLLYGVVLASVGVLGCGSSQPVAQAPSSCANGQTLVSGHFRGQACVRSADAATAKVCAETQYELDVIERSNLRDPQPGALQSEFEQTARESATILANAAATLKATHESISPVDIKWLARHRAWLLAYAIRVQSAHRVDQNFGTWFRPLVTHDLACQHRESIPWPKQAQ